MESSRGVRDRCGVAQIGRLLVKHLPPPSKYGLHPVVFWVHPLAFKLPVVPVDLM